MYEKMLSLESRQMENNIVIHGLEEKQDEDTDSTLQHFLKIRTPRCNTS